MKTKKERKALNDLSKAKEIERESKKMTLNDLEKVKGGSDGSNRKEFDHIGNFNF